MASSVLQVRVEEGLRAEASAIYEALGIDLQTAVRIFLKRSVMENGLPFGMTLPDKKETAAQAARQAMRRMSEAAARAGVSDMSPEEIDAEIAAVRRGEEAQI